jgi:4-hydroxybenzoate polyprenyltransferase
MTTLTHAPVQRIPRWGAAELRLCLLEARPAVQMIFMLRFLAGIALVSPTLTWQSGEQLVAGIGVWEAVVVCIYVLNGVSDIVEDRANRSRRPIASGRLEAHTAAWVAGSAGVVGLVGAALLGGAFLADAVAMLAIGVAYSAGPVLKRSRSGAAASVTAAGVLTYGAGSVLLGAGPPAPLVVLAVVMSLWMGLVGAVTKDFSDVEGDRAAGRYRNGDDGLRLRVRACLSAVVVAACAMAVAALLAPVLLLPFLVLAAGAAAVVGTTATTWHSADRAVRRRPYRAFMATQYAVHVALACPLLLAAFG